MGAMIKAKIGHPNAAANTAWVPSPTAGTIHALHYHQVNVDDKQAKECLLTEGAERTDFDIEKLIQPPYLDADTQLSKEEIEAELKNNVQGLLGYVVRWIQLGMGCSKVPNINGIG